MSRPILDMYNSGEIDEVVLIYTSFISSMEQEVKNVTLLPFEVEKDPEIIRDTKQVEYEPSVEAVFNYLVPKYVEMMVYAAVVESATCEHAARRMAMETPPTTPGRCLDSFPSTITEPDSRPSPMK